MYGTCTVYSGVSVLSMFGVSLLLPHIHFFFRFNTVKQFNLWLFDCFCYLAIFKTAFVFSCFKMQRKEFIILLILVPLLFLTLGTLTFKFWCIISVYRVFLLFVVKSLKCYHCIGEDCRTELDCSILFLHQSCLKLTTTKGLFSKNIIIKIKGIT